MIPADLGAAPLLVDTDVFSYVVWHREPFSWYKPFLVNRLWILSFATVGELRHGAMRAKWGTAKLTTLQNRIDLCVVASATDAMTHHWAKLSTRFHDQIGINDLWIAATALAQDPPLAIVSNDKAFERIGNDFGLTVVRKPCN